MVTPVGLGSFDLLPVGRRWLDAHCKFSDVLSSPNRGKRKHNVTASLFGGRDSLGKEGPNLSPPSCEILYQQLGKCLEFSQRLSAPLLAIRGDEVPAQRDVILVTWSVSNGPRVVF
ncbi:hypothetical protein TNCV_4915931 [Trichonephila clavipes]|nr:hypothetical protein TNCV_4915931 [Trichonephila clavipes]